MIVSDENYPEILDQICKFLGDIEVELSIVDSDKMREINKSERNIDKSTDVLSFPFEPVPHTPLGCIVINCDLCEQKATELSHTKDEEMALLFTHGLLHILGFDHENDNGQMRKKEEEVIAKFKLPKSLIVRTCDA
ncbi:MAG: rRNA maturation RNase YbeY [Campylobacter sp.]|nr:rRNA maturation RNase YbeY [Campylobacter sp.]